MTYIGKIDSIIIVEQFARRLGELLIKSVSVGSVRSASCTIALTHHTQHGSPRRSMRPTSHKLRAHSERVQHLGVVSGTHLYRALLLLRSDPH